MVGCNAKKQMKNALKTIARLGNKAIRLRSSADKLFQKCYGCPMPKGDNEEAFLEYLEKSRGIRARKIVDGNLTLKVQKAAQKLPTLSHTFMVACGDRLEELAKADNDELNDAYERLVAKCNEAFRAYCECVERLSDALQEYQDLVE